MSTKDTIVTESISSIIERMSMRTGVPVEHILNRTNHSTVALRRRIAQEARRQNYSLPEIGRALNKDHTTILYLLRGKKRKGESNDTEDARGNGSGDAQ